MVTSGQEVLRVQWVLQAFEDTHKLAHALEILGLPFTLHKVVPFVGDLLPEPDIPDPSDVVLFGSYTLRHYAARHGLSPGVFTLRPFLHEPAWRPFLLNGEAMVMTLAAVPARLADASGDWFLRPVEDSKEVPGRVMAAAEIVTMARKVLALPEDELPRGSLRHDTMLMLTLPVRILREWRVWIVGGKAVTWSLYKEGQRVVYRHEIDDDALGFARQVAAANPDYARAYVMDICRTADGLRLLETNCINAAGFYAADVTAMAAALEALPRG